VAVSLNQVLRAMTASPVDGNEKANPVQTVRGLVTAEETVIKVTSSLQRGDF